MIHGTVLVAWGCVELNIDLAFLRCRFVSFFRGTWGSRFYLLHPYLQDGGNLARLNRWDLISYLFVYFGVIIIDVVEYHGFLIACDYSSSLSSPKMLLNTSSPARSPSRASFLSV